MNMATPQFKAFPEKWDWDSIVGKIAIVIFLFACNLETLPFRACYCALQICVCYVPVASVMSL